MAFFGKSDKAANRKRSAAKNLLGVIDILSQADEYAQKGIDVEQVLGDLLGFLPKDQDIAPPDTNDIHYRIAGLPFTLNEAVHFLGLSRIVNRRIRDGYYRNRLVILATQEKSSSTLHEVAILEMLHRSAGVKTIVPMPRSLVAGPTTMASGTTFHLGMLLYFPNGGVCRGVFVPNRQNRVFRREVGCRAIALTRHPADRIVAQFCMRHAELASETGSENHEIGYNAVFRGEHRSVHIDSLWANLEWLRGWSDQSKDSDVLVVRYEDMIADLDTHFEGIHRFLFRAAMGVDLSERMTVLFENSGENGDLRSGDVEDRVYPKGYSGKVGIWADYLTEENVRVYTEVVERFLNSAPNSDALLDLYPDLVLS